MTHITKKKK